MIETIVEFLKVVPPFVWLAMYWKQEWHRRDLENANLREDLTRKQRDRLK